MENYSSCSEVEDEDTSDSRFSFMVSSSSLVTELISRWHRMGSSGPWSACRYSSRNHPSSLGASLARSKQDFCSLFWMEGSALKLSSSRMISFFFYELVELLARAWCSAVFPRSNKRVPDCLHLKLGSARLVRSSSTTLSDLSRA